MSKTARFSMVLMLVASSYMVTNVSAGEVVVGCLLYISDAADDLLCVYLGGRRINKKKTHFE